MYRDISVVVVIPAYNEEAMIGHVVRSIPGFVDWIIVVDDGSVDETINQVAAVNDPRVILEVLAVNGGLGTAMKAGYRKALELDPYVIVKVDGDGQMPVEHMEALLDAVVIADFDYSKGNRLLGHLNSRGMSGLRRIGNMGLTFLTKVASGYWNVFDPQNGFVAIRATTLRELPMKRVHPKFFFENDMLVELNILGCRVKDVSMPAVYGSEVSGMGVISTLLSFPPLLIHRFARRIHQKYVLRDFSPIALFLAAGLLLKGWGVGFGIYLWVRSVETGIEASTGSVMLAAIPLVLGFQLLLQACVLDINETPR